MKIIRVLMVGLFVGVALLAQTNVQKPPNSLTSAAQRGPITTIFPKITGSDPDCVGTASCGIIEVYGQNFGTTQGARRIFYDGALPKKVSLWKDAVICILPNANPAFWPVHHTFYIDDGAGKKLSNTFDIVYLYKFDGAIPSQGTPGMEIKIFSWGCGAQAGKSLRMGATPMTINFWPGGADWEYFTPIRAVVPNLAPGTYAITMHSGAPQVSKSSTSFKIN